MMNTHHSPDFAAEPEWHPQPCAICGEPYECDGATHRHHERMVAQRNPAALALPGEPADDEVPF